METLFLALSAATFGILVIHAYFSEKPMKSLFAGTSMGLFFIFISYRIVEGFHFSTSITASLFNTFRVFLFNEDMNFVLEAFSDGRIRLYISLLYVVAPILLLTSILSYIAEVSTQLKLGLYRFGKKDFYIFSELNIKSILLAEDLVRHNSKARLIFTDDQNKSESIQFNLVERAKTLGALFIHSGLLESNWLQKLKRHRVHFMLLSENQHNNLELGIALNQRYQSILNGGLYILSESVESEMLLDSMEKSGLKIRRISEIQTIVQNLFINHPLYESAQNGYIEVLVIGGGSIGTEVVKTAAWCGQMEHHTLSITLVDYDQLAFEKLKLTCPELVDTCNIEFKCIHVETPELYDLLNDHQTATYVVIALSEDDFNSRTAITIRSYFERIRFGRTMPKILTHVESFEKSRLLQNLKSSQNQPFSIIPFGSKESIYQSHALLQNELEAKALKLHLYLGYKEKEFDEAEYNRKASIATALHAEYKIRSVGGTDYKDYAQYLLNPDHMDRQKRVEHDRWNAYTRADGFVSASLDEAKEYMVHIKHHKNNLAKKHACLIPFDDLDPLTELVQPLRKIDFKDQDVKTLQWIAAGYPSKGASND